MKKTYAIAFVGLLLLFSSLFGGCSSSIVSDVVAAEKSAQVRQTDLFEKAVAIIKKYETLHKPKHWPLVGYGHKVLPGEKYSRTRTLTEKEADELLRKDLRKLCAIYRSYGRDSILLATLAYNIGHGAVNRSSIVTKLKAGDRNIESTYLSYCRYRGKQHAGIRRRRVEEFENLFTGTEPLAEVNIDTPLLLRPFIDDNNEFQDFAQWFAEAVCTEPELAMETNNESLQDSTL